MMKRIFFLIVPIVALLVSCDKSRVFEENKTISGEAWNKDSIMRFEVDIIDTTQLVNFYVNVRNADGYPYRNIILFIKTNFPNGRSSVDSLNCLLADEKGNWLGNGMGDIFDNQILFVKNRRFPMPGKYLFEIQHGLRVDNAPLIMDIGLRIEKAE